MGVLNRQFGGAATRQAIGENTTWLMLGRIFELSLRFFVGAWVIRYLGPEQFGVYSYALSFVAIFVDIAALGLDQIVVRDLARGTSPPGEVLATAFSLRAWAAVVTFGLVVLASAIVDTESSTRMAVLIAAGQLFFNPANVFDLWFQARLRSRYVVVIRGAVTLLIAAAQIACIVAGLPLLAFLVLALIHSALTGAGMLFSFRIAGPETIHWRRSGKLAIAMLRDAWPLALSALSVSVYMRIDQVMLGLMVGIDAVGVYGAAVKVSEVWYFVPTALAMSAFPGIVQMRLSASLDVYHGRLQALCDAMAAYSYLVILVMTLGAPLFIDVLFGRTFDASVAVLRVHIWSLIFVSLGLVYSRWLVAEERAIFSMVSAVLGAIANVGLNVVLIPSYGALGAAWATLISYAISAYLSALLFRPLRPMFVRMSKALVVPLRWGSSWHRMLPDGRP